MEIAFKYLDKNYYINDNTVFKSESIPKAVTWFEVINDFKPIFSLQYEDSKAILESWVRNKGLNPNTIFIFNDNIIGIITINDSECVFPINNMEYSITNENEFRPFGYDNIIGNSLRIQHHEFTIEINEEVHHELFISTPANTVASYTSNKFKMVIHKSGIQYFCDGCLVSSIDTNIGYDDYDYVSSNITFTVRPDVVRVELMYDES